MQARSDVMRKMAGLPQEDQRAYFTLHVSFAHITPIKGNSQFRRDQIKPCMRIESMTGFHEQASETFVKDQLFTPVAFSLLRSRFEDIRVGKVFVVSRQEDGGRHPGREARRACRL